MSSRVRLALVGCGAIAEMHRFAIADSAAPIDIVATVDTDLDRARAFAEATGAQPFTSLQDAIDSGLADAVDLMVPHQLHEELAIQSLQAGLHVLLEKPMATTIPECARILRAADASDRVFMVAENAQYWPEVCTARDLLADGAIGDVVSAQAKTYFPPLPDFYGSPDAWRMRRTDTGGGIAIDTCSHWIRPLRMWFGEVAEVTGATGRPVQQMEGESLVQALLRFESGVVATLDALLTDAPIADPVFFRITGSDGEISIDNAGRCLLANRTHRRPTHQGELGGYLASYNGEFLDFANAVLHDQPLAASAAWALGELQVALALYRSVESGRWEPTR